MQRPFADSRPLGPFVESSSSQEVDFIITYNMETFKLDGVHDDIEDNINDKLTSRYGDAVEGASMLTRSRDEVEVKVKLDTPMFSDSHEDEIIESVKQELGRIAQTNVTQESYRYEF